MFWKKKAADPAGFEFADVEVAEDRRDAFRISTPPDDPVVVNVLGQDYRASNISVGGLAVRGAPLEPGSVHNIRLLLPDSSPPILTRMAVIKVTARGVCRCRFLQLSRMSRNAIQVYILRREKEQIRTRTLGSHGAGIADDD